MTPTAIMPPSVLRHRPFVLFWCARICAAIGYQMLGVAVGWQMYALTGNPLDLGLVGLVQFIPAAALGAGRRPGRRPLRPPPHAAVCQTVEAVAAAACFGSVCRRDQPGIHPGVAFYPGRRARLRGADDADPGAGAGAAAAGAARGRGLGIDQPDRHHRRPGARRLPLRGRSDRGLYVCLRCCSSRRPCCLTFVRIERAAPARAVQPAGLLRGLRLHPPQSDRARRDLARPVRGAARRRDRAAADVRRDVFGPAPWASACCAPRPRSARSAWRRADALAVRARRRADHVRGGRRLRALDHRVRAVELVRRWRSRRSRCSAPPTWSAW